MRVGRFLAVVLAALSFAAPVAAQTFEDFKRFCLDTGGDLLRARAAASAAGWRIDRRGEAATANTDVTLWSDPAMVTPSPEMLMVGHFQSPGGTSAPTCSIIGSTSLERLGESMSAYVGFGSEQTSRGNASWIYTMGPDGPVQRRGLADVDDAALLAAAEAGDRLHVVQTRTARSGPLIAHFFIDPSDAAPPQR